MPPLLCVPCCDTEVRDADLRIVPGEVPEPHSGSSGRTGPGVGVRDKLISDRLARFMGDR